MESRSICETCGREFSPEESSALDDCDFCSASCEDVYDANEEDWYDKDEEGP